MDRKITDYERDSAGDWVAILECGHRQHLRHRPPWLVRDWVTSEEGRASMLGTALYCTICDEGKGGVTEERRSGRG